METPASISVDKILTSGYYTVGTDIPAGTYNLKAVARSGNVMTNDGLLKKLMGTILDQLKHLIMWL